MNVQNNIRTDQLYSDTTGSFHDEHWASSNVTFIGSQWNLHWSTWRYRVYAKFLSYLSIWYPEHSPRALCWLQESTENRKLRTIFVVINCKEKYNRSQHFPTVVARFLFSVVELQEYTGKYGKHGLSKSIFCTGRVQEAGQDRRTRLDSSLGIWARHFHRRRNSSQCLSPLK